MAMTDKTILIVDDEPANLKLLTGVLGADYLVRAVNSGAQALRAASLPPVPDLILLDIMMPEISGLQVMRQLKENAATRDIPVFFVTALDSVGDEQQGLDLGAVDYITKPIVPGIVRARVRMQLELKQARDQLARQNVILESKIAERTKSLKQALETAKDAHEQLKKTHFSTLMAISDLVQLRSDLISDHCRHVADISRQVALKLGVPPFEAQDIFVAALLHDIGKIGFSDVMLDKPISQMNTDETTLYRKHPVAGADILGRIAALSGIADQIRYHHEFYNGSGFPEGRVGLHIPLGARIICAVSDYEALQSGGLTTTPLTAKESCQYLLEHSGTRYDPSVIEALEPILTAFGKFKLDEVPVKATHLHEGMRLSRDAKDADGFLLLVKDTILSTSLIEQLIAVERRAGQKVRLFVYRNPAE